MSEGSNHAYPKGSITRAFPRDNMATVKPILSLGKPIMIGDRERTLKELLAECRIEPTESGKIYVHPGHGKNELAENLSIARWRAEQFGEEVVLLPNPQGIKSADSYNISRGVMEEYKVNATPSLNSVDGLIRTGSKQADHIILEIDSEISSGTLSHAMQSRVKRTEGLEEIRLKVGNAEAVYSREQITAKGFKIKPGDFHNVSASRSGGSSLTSDEAGSISDAKVQRLFGINKKTPQEIAKERHAARTPEQAMAIQQAWNARRIDNLRASIKKGLLPPEVEAKLKELSALPMPDAQKQFNERIAFYQSRASKHAARTPKKAADIQVAWDAKLKRDVTTKLVANNVLKVVQGWSEVDYARLQQLIADNNLGKMREEARNVAKAIKEMRDKENALADIIPDVHAWHKQFSLAKLQAVKDAVNKKLGDWEIHFNAYLEAGGEANLDVLKKKLNFEISWVEQHKKFSTWQVAQSAYVKKLAAVEAKIELNALTSQYTALLGFSTKSPNFAAYMTKAKAALDAGDINKAKNHLAGATAQKEKLEKAAARRAAKAGGAVTGSGVGSLDELYGGACPFTAEERKKLADYESRIATEMMATGRIDSLLNQRYESYVLKLSEKYYSQQTSIYTAAEQAAMKQSADRYLARPSINPNYVWGTNVGGVYKGRYQKRHAYLKKLGKGITADELSIVQRFTNGSTFSNAYNLRHSSPYWAKKWKEKMAMLTPAQAKEMEEIIEEWSQGANFTLDRMVRYNGITFRGLDSGGGLELRKQLLDAFTQGKPWVNEASCSTSMRLSVAEGFDGDVILVIHNKTGAYIHPISDYSTEYEIMTLRGAKYRILKPPTQIGRRYFVELEEI